MNEYELWEAGKGWKIRRLFVRKDHNGDRLRAELPKGAKVTWTTKAETFFDAMTAYWKHLDRGKYTTEDHIFPGEELHVAKKLPEEAPAEA